MAKKFLSGLLAKLLCGKEATDNAALVDNVSRYRSYRGCSRVHRHCWRCDPDRVGFIRNLHRTVYRQPVHGSRANELNQELTVTSHYLRRQSHEIRKGAIEYRCRRYVGISPRDR